jgi:hypothetical protein
MSEWNSYVKLGKGNGLKSDTCNISQRNRESNKSLEYNLQSFGPTEANIGNVTHDKHKQNLPGLPNAAPSYSPGRGPDFEHIGTEDVLRPNGVRMLASCNKEDSQFYKRSFYIFDGLPVIPNSDINHIVQRGTDYYQGIDTRHIQNIKFRKRC